MRPGSPAKSKKSTHLETRPDKNEKPAGLDLDSIAAHREAAASPSPKKRRVVTLCTPPVAGPVDGTPPPSPSRAPSMRPRSTDRRRATSTDRRARSTDRARSAGRHRPGDGAGGGVSELGSPQASRRRPRRRGRRTSSAAGSELANSIVSSWRMRRETTHYCCGAPGLMIHPHTPFCQIKDLFFIVLVLYLLR